MLNNNLERGTIAAVVCMLLDQLHKFTMLELFHFENGVRKTVTGFFDLVMVWNRGISFGMFQGLQYSNYFFMGFASMVIFVLFYFMREAKTRLEAIAFGMIIGGACGNLVDRIRIGAVADFFDFHYGTYHWPAFNVADSCVFLGAALLVISTLSNNEKKNEK
jgi:signal peptidase II